MTYNRLKEILYILTERNTLRHFNFIPHSISRYMIINTQREGKKKKNSPLPNTNFLSPIFYLSNSSSALLSLSVYPSSLSFLNNFLYLLSPSFFSSFLFQFLSNFLATLSHYFLSTLPLLLFPLSLLSPHFLRLFFSLLVSQLFSLHTSLFHSLISLA